MELSFWGACGIVGADKSDKVITGGQARRYRSDVNKKIRRLKNSGSACRACVPCKCKGIYI